jgi:hypothetical protein
MAGTIVANTINTDTGIYTTLNALNGVAKAWVNFLGASGAVNSFFNVSSVTRNSSGNYTINFTTAMPNANYAVQVTFGVTATSTPYAPQVITGSQTTTTSVVTAYGFDPTNMYVTYFGA